MSLQVKSMSCFSMLTRYFFQRQISEIVIQTECPSVNPYWCFMHLIIMPETQTRF